MDIYKLYSHYERSDLVRHRAMVYFPYAIMSFKLVEYYTLGIPLFMPSPRFFRNTHAFGPDRAVITHGCSDKKLADVMEPHPTNTHPYSPNELGGEAEYY